MRNAATVIEVKLLTMLSMNVVLLIHKKLTGSIVPSEECLLTHWLEADIENRRVYEEIKVIWEASDHVEDYIPVGDQDIERDLAILERHIRTQHSRSTTRSSNELKQGVVVLLSILLVGACTFFGMKWTTKEEKRVVRASSGDNVTFVLPDSSLIVLNDSSALGVELGSDGREVTLSGEAYFDVRDDSGPFLINGPDFQVIVLGTSLVVRSYSDETADIVVVSGQVKVRFRGREQLVNTGERITLYKSGEVESGPNENRNFVAWYTHRLTFKQDPLREVLAEVERCYRVSFQFDDARIGACRFTGTFDKMALDDIMRVLSYTLDVRFIPDRGSRYKVEGDGCH